MTKVVKILEVIELHTPADHQKMIKRLLYWSQAVAGSEFAVKTIREGKSVEIVLINRRKIRSDAGKERVSRTGFRRGINPLPKNLDKINPHNKKG